MKFTKLYYLTGSLFLNSFETKSYSYTSLLNINEYKSVFDIPFVYEPMFDGVYCVRSSTLLLKNERTVDFIPINVLLAAMSSKW